MGNAQARQRLKGSDFHYLSKFTAFASNEVRKNICHCTQKGHGSEQFNLFKPIVSVQGQWNMHPQTPPAYFLTLGKNV